MEVPATIFKVLFIDINGKVCELKEKAQRRFDSGRIGNNFPVAVTDTDRDLPLGTKRRIKQDILDGSLSGRS